MFASVGGLALLAEHLPLMYPEISRQAISPDGGATTRDTGGGPAGSASVGHDWVTIESSEDMYEVSQGIGESFAEEYIHTACGQLSSCGEGIAIF